MMQHLKNEYNLLYSFSRCKDNKIYECKCSSLPSTMYLGDLSAYSDFEKAALFNRFFESVLHKQSDITSTEYINFDTTDTLLEINIIITMFS